MPTKCAVQANCFFIGLGARCNGIQLGLLYGLVIELAFIIRGGGLTNRRLTKAAKFCHTLNSNFMHFAHQ